MNKLIFVAFEPFCGNFFFVFFRAPSWMKWI